MAELASTCVARSKHSGSMAAAFDKMSPEPRSCAMRIGQQRSLQAPHCVYTFFWIRHDVLRLVGGVHDWGGSHGKATAAGKPSLSWRKETALHLLQNCGCAHHRSHVWLCIHGPGVTLPGVLSSLHICIVSSCTRKMCSAAVFYKLHGSMVARCGKHLTVKSILGDSHAIFAYMQSTCTCS